VIVFRWKETEPGVYTGVIGHAVWQLKQSDTEIFYKVHHTSKAVKDFTCVKKEKWDENASMYLEGQR